MSDIWIQFNMTLNALSLKYCHSSSCYIFCFSMHCRLSKHSLNSSGDHPIFLAGPMIIPCGFGPWHPLRCPTDCHDVPSFEAHPKLLWCSQHDGYIIMLYHSYTDTHTHTHTYIYIYETLTYTCVLTHFARTDNTMYVYIYIYIYIYISIYISKHTRTHTHISMIIYVYMYMYIYIYYVYNPCICMYACMYIYIYTIYIYIYACLVIRFFFPNLCV